MNEIDNQGVRRREALVLLGGMGLAGIAGACGATGATGTGGTATAEAAASCVLSPEVTEGPYWVDTTLTRRDVRQGRPGLPLQLAFTVENAKTCKPIAGADVEIWHADAGGNYSNARTLFLRGHQKASASGRATFLTIFPGWYPGRTPHIHLKVHVGGNTVHTGQIFFDETTTAAVYKRSPYKVHGRADTPHSADNIYAQAGGSRAIAKTRRVGGGLRGAIVLGVAT
jgi:protocatechuate 3,4-dioxygenase beta subunit